MCALIPEQLKGWKFILVVKAGKVAFEKDWQTTANYAYDDPKLITWLKEGGNYGVLPTGRQLIIDIDRDGMDGLRTTLIQSLGPTFTVKTPHGGEHRYYVLDDNQDRMNLPLTDFKTGRNAGHIKAGSGGYVVGPGSRIEE